MGRREEGSGSRGKWRRERTKVGGGMVKGGVSRARVSRLREQEGWGAVQRC